MPRAPEALARNGSPIGLTNRLGWRIGARCCGCCASATVTAPTAKAPSAHVVRNRMRTTLITRRTRAAWRKFAEEEEAKLIGQDQLGGKAARRAVGKFE